MNTTDTRIRPQVMDTLSETQLKELEFQAEEYDAEQFLRIGATYGWNEETTRDVWKWFEVLHKYPLEGTVPAE